MDPVAPDADQAAAACPTASVPTITAAASRSRRPGAAGRTARPGPLVSARQLPGARSRSVDHERQPGRERDRAAGGVVDGAGRPAPLRPPRRTEARAGQQERDRSSAHRSAGAASAAAGAGRRRRAPPAARSGRRRPRRARSDSPSSGSASKAQQRVEILGGERRPVGLLERPGVEDDADAGRLRDTVGLSGLRRAESRGRRRGHPPSPAGTSRPASA